MPPHVHSLFEEAFLKLPLKVCWLSVIFKPIYLLLLFPINIPLSEEFVSKLVNFGDICSFSGSSKGHRKFEKCLIAENTTEKSNGEVFICFCSFKRGRHSLTVVESSVRLEFKCPTFYQFKKTTYLNSIGLPFLSCMVRLLMIVAAS